MEMLTRREQEILDNAPEGATHYAIHAVTGECLQYMKEAVELGGWYRTRSLADLRRKQGKTVVDGVVEKMAVIDKKQGKTVVDAVNYYHGDIESTDAKCIVSSNRGSIDLWYCDDFVALDTPKWSPLCTIEEFNQCVKELSYHAGVDAFVEYVCNKRPTKPFLQTGEEFEHTKALNFIRERMIEVHGENPHYDYMHKLNNAIIFVERAEEPSKTGVEPVKPRTKVEYEGVHQSVAVKAVLEGGKDYYFKGGDDSYILLTMQSELEKFCRAFKEVETEITWQDELKDKYPAIDFNWLDDDGQHDLGSWNPKDFIEMCHFVTSLTK
jgi:hypothetical protein